MILGLCKRIRWYTSAIRFAYRSMSFKIWLSICTVSIVAGLVVDIGMTKLCLLVAIAMLGLGLETANSAIEHLCNLIEPKHNPDVKVIKDAFGAVPALMWSTYIICWLILVAPTIYLRLTQ